MQGYIFPGQGSQFKGMGEDLFNSVPLFRVFEDRFDQIVNFSIRETCLTSDPEFLKKTEVTQPCLFIVNALYWEKAKASGAVPDLLAGHSLGEYNALYAANVFDIETGLYLVKERGCLMAKATDGGMAAVIGLDRTKLKKVLNRKKHKKIDIANYNTPKQIIISGPKDQVLAAEADLIKAGADLFVPLQVGAAFHSRYMSESSKEFSEILNDVHLRSPQSKVYSNVTSKLYPENARSEDIAELLTKQIVSPVLWDSIIVGLRKAGVQDIFEIGPGEVLSRMMSDIN